MPRQVINHNHSPHKRTRIVTAYNLGMKAKTVGLKEGISARAVYAIVERYGKQQSAKDQPRSGRPPLLDGRHKRHIFRCIEEDPFVSNRELIEKCALPCSVSTVTRFLRKEGIQHYRALRRPKLTPDVAAKRLEFARLHVRKPLSWWKRWIFSDEVTIARGEGEKQKWVFCRKVRIIEHIINLYLTSLQGEQLFPRNVQPRGMPTRHSQMFWGAVCGLKQSSLAPLIGDPEAARGGITGRRIMDCLEEHLPTVAEPGDTFIHDNVPNFTARIVQSWLRDWAVENGVNLTDWPPYSPDLNPIENIWHIIKERICKAHPELIDMPKNDDSKQRLCEAAIEAWESFEPRVLTNLYKSMRSRMEAVIAAEGWYTKY
jgi:transposase